ncbi:hypothetical protein O6H91_03G106100 [Diphasiastrum complanatum]|nr:hypothetical protein O6H91_03G106100 [Diphasiastrum complanatum]KAJ7563327.1 hypothetical protein O6H91_03G106100 [Diphasiastrum complanatum]KAJ7563328.1 hypothetical protein O6H91_03G106100 [Diphasiastrum complanatum]KAJ7563329.1 hypothetical protein O6H91_03G106100 [Diphasiastrum complanatum]KAJ7563331.1 hypothetical protein O6H91_03G106100 [Diphasiastrum complanatum]
MATATRSHELMSRVQQLEAEIPVMEKAFLSKSDRLTFAYSRGAEWHARICVRQNHCSEGDLPQFVRNSYEKCRGPPKFFLLDKFDIGDAGTCHKRYSDPSFFKTKWANSELKQAEKVREDRRARRMKKRNYCGNGKVRSGTFEPRPAARRVRYSSLSSDTWDSYSDISTPCSNFGVKAKVLQSCQQIFEGNSSQGLTGKNIYGMNGQKVWPSQKLQTLRELLLADEAFGPLRLSAKEIEAETLSGQYKSFEMFSELEQKVDETLEEDTVEDIVSEEDQFVDAMTTMDSETESESTGRTESISDLTENTRDLVDVLAMQCPSDDDSLDEKQDDISVQEMDHMFEHRLETVDMMFTELSYSTSPSHSSNYSTDKEEHFSIENEAQANNHFWYRDENFAKDVSGIKVRDEKIPPLPPVQMVSRPQNHPVAVASEQTNRLSKWQVRSTNNSSPAVTATAEVCRASPAHRLLPESTIHSKEQSSETSHEQDSVLRREECKSKKGFGTKPTLRERMTADIHFLERNRSLPKNSADAKIDCSKRRSQGSPPVSVSRSFKLHADKHCLAEISLYCTDDNGVSPKPPTLSDSSHSSSSTRGSPPSNILVDLGADAEPTNSPSAGSFSNASSPKSPIFSALDSPMSPINSFHLSASSKSGRSATSDMRLRSPILVPKLLSSPSLEGTPSPPPPLPSLKLSSKQTLHGEPGQFNKTLQAPPTPPPPPPPPPPRMISKLAQPASQAKQASRSVPRGPRNDDLIKSISMYDRSQLRKVSAEKRSPKPKVMDEREILLEQIRNKTFTLRRTAAEKHDAANRLNPDIINVAAILERANAIRQAFAGSDEEDTNEEWTEGQN